MSLSVVVIVRNEERNLPGFLKSFSSIADEIVIVDDGSTDRTKEIAQSETGTIKFVESPRNSEEGFCDQRQKGVNAASCRWLLQVDCDMRLTKELAEEIESVIQEGNEIAFQFRLEQYFFNRPVRYGGFQYWNQAWLSRRDLTYWEQKVHERVCFHKPGEIGHLQHRMIHLNDFSFRDRLNKNMAYSELEAEKLIAAGRRIRFWDFLLFPFWRAVRSYVVMSGYRDGMIGFLWSLYQFVGLTTIYFLAWEKQSAASREDIELEAVDRLKGFSRRK